MAPDCLYIKDQLLSHKAFFRDLYKGSAKGNSRLLHKASESELDLLIKVLHLICEGDIHLTKENHANIKKSKRLNFLKKHFNSYQQARKTLELPTVEKVTILKNLGAVYKDLLFALFNLL